MKSLTLPSPTTAALERINPKLIWHHTALLQLRQELLRAQTEHKRAATSPPETGGIDLAEAAQDESDHGVILAELLAESDRLAEIDAALHRIRAGTYGVCEKTGKPISKARLRAIPWTRYALSKSHV
jgi:RNA polymerase-binding transcription factor DksA